MVPALYLVYPSLLCYLYIDRQFWLASQLDCKSTAEGFMLFDFSKMFHMHCWYFTLSASVFIGVTDYHLCIAVRYTEEKQKWIRSCQEEARMRDETDLSNISSVSHFSSVSHTHYSIDIQFWFS